MRTKADIVKLDQVIRKWQTAALKAGFGVSVCAVLSLHSASVFAQTSPASEPVSASEGVTATHDAETPLSARPDMSLIADEALPINLQPEELAIPQGQTLALSKKDRKRAKRRKANNRNSWDLDMLTQSASLTAASFQTQAPTSNIAARIVVKSVGAEPRAIDLISSEDLLDFDATVQLAMSGLQNASRTDGVINLDSPIRGSLFDLPTNDNMNTSVFKLDMADQLCLGTSSECAANEAHSLDIGYAKNITHGKLDGFNVQLSPRAGLRFDEESKSALVGALVRIGDNLREGSEMKSNTWYFFAGADAEAVTFTPNSIRRLTSGDFHLQDRIIVGDAQAGLGYRFGTADLALTYFKRQASAENYKYDEDAAALSITWKR